MEISKYYKSGVFFESCFTNTLLCTISLSSAQTCSLISSPFLQSLSSAPLSSAWIPWTFFVPQLFSSFILDFSCASLFMHRQLSCIEDSQEFVLTGVIRGNQFCFLFFFAQAKLWEWNARRCKISSSGNHKYGYHCLYILELVRHSVVPITLKRQVRILNDQLSQSAPILEHTAFSKQQPKSVCPRVHICGWLKYSQVNVERDNCFRPGGTLEIILSNLLINLVNKQVQRNSGRSRTRIQIPDSNF